MDTKRTESRRDPEPEVIMRHIPLAIAAALALTLQVPAQASEAGSDGGTSVVIVAGTGLLLPPNGSEGIVQTAASLPRGFADETVAYDQARSIERFLSGRETHAHVAAQPATKTHQG